MDFESVRKFVEKEGGDNDEITVDSMPEGFIEPLVTEGLQIDHLEPGRLVCSFIVPPRLLNAGNTLHGGATATLVDMIGSGVIQSTGAEIPGVSVEINVSYFDGATVGEEIEIEAKTLRVGKAIAVASVEFRNKKTGKTIAQGRHTKYLVALSKM